MLFLLSGLFHNPFLLFFSLVLFPLRFKMQVAYIVHQTICNLHPACSTHLIFCYFSIHTICHSYAELLTFSKLSILFYAWRGSPNISFSEKSPSILTDLINLFFISKFHLGHFSCIQLILYHTTNNCLNVVFYSHSPVPNLPTSLP